MKGETKLRPIRSGTRLFKTISRFNVYDLGIFRAVMTLRSTP